MRKERQQEHWLRNLWREEEDIGKIVTLCKGLDLRLHKGISRNNITEFCGPPGSGKTQFCLQLCINVQFPTEVGGVCGKALFIDTNQGFNPHRLKEIADFSSKKVNEILGKKIETTTFTTNLLLKNVTYTYCKNCVQLIAIVENLREVILTSECKIKLIAIDSFSYLFRNFENLTERTRILCEILTNLQKLATEFSIAVVITNELTTRKSRGEWKVGPALGEGHSHKIGYRIVLSKQKETTNFVAFVNKRFSISRFGIPFQIKTCGIRGVE